MTPTSIRRLTRGALGILFGAALIGCAAILGGEPGILDEGIEHVDPDAVAPDGPLTPDADDAAACTADTTKDPMNCGRCGRDCQGGDCKSSQCTPVKIAANLPAPYYLGQDATHLYLSSFNTGHVTRIAKDGKSATQRIIDVPTGRSFAVAVDDTYLYASDVSRRLVVRTPKVGGGPIDELMTNVEVDDIIVDKGIVYTTRYDSPDGGLGALERMLPDGGARMTIAGNILNCEGLALSPDNFYVGVTLQILPRAGGSPTQIPGTNARRIVYADGLPYWVGYDRRGVSRLSSIGVVEALADAGGGEVEQGSLAVDDRYAYWTSTKQGDHNAYVAPRDPSSPEPARVLLKGIKPSGIVVDERSIYIADLEADTVVRITR